MGDKRGKKRKIECVDGTSKKLKRDEAPTFKLATWNIAAINNNPFEYWLTYDEDPNYVKLMEDVENFIENPGENDVPVKNVFTDDMFNTLKSVMEKHGWQGLEVVEKYWNEEYRERKIITEFLKDKTIGAKRLASMPDRITNTINLDDGSQIYRPTCINMYEGELDSTEQWFDQWMEFMFEQSVQVKGGEPKNVCDLLSPIKKAKYPAITEEEEAVSIPLQTVLGAVFDSILIHMLNTVAPGVWMPIKLKLGEKLNKKKLDRTVDIISTQYLESDVFFLQEVSAVFADRFKNSPLPEYFDLHVPVKLDGKRDQNSMILTNKQSGFEFVAEVTKEILDVAEEKIGCGDGDLFAFHAIKDGENYILASFHGDTNGLQTIPIVTTVHRAIEQKYEGYKLLFGLDANVYAKESKKTQPYMGFVSAYQNIGLQSLFGDRIDPNRFTTFNARTYLQPQLNKACKKSEMRDCGDVNPKDFILFYPEHFAPLTFGKDNTGKREYVEDVPFPTLDFPSDHGVLFAEIRIMGHQN